MVYWVRFQKRVGRPCASTEQEVAASTRSRRVSLDIMNMNLGLSLVGMRARLNRMGPRAYSGSSRALLAAATALVSLAVPLQLRRGHSLAPNLTNSFTGPASWQTLPA